MKVLLLLLACLAAAHAQAIVTVTPNYDYPEEKAKIFYIRRALVLKCEPSVQGEQEIRWLKDGFPVNEVADLKNRYSASGFEFRIKYSEGRDAGVYECFFPMINVRAQIEAIANVQVNLPSDSYVVEDENLRIVCTVVGTKPVISWLVGNESYPESRDRVTLSEDNGIANAVLEMSAMQMDDRSVFTCIGRNRASQLLGENSEDETLVRVRSKYAALWPFLGICVEVLVLCTGIWICERRRLKKMAEEESDDDDSNARNGKSGGLRQRH